MLTALYCDELENPSMLEFNGLVYSVENEQKTIQPTGETKTIKEYYIDNVYILHWQDQTGNILSVQFSNGNVFELRVKGDIRE